MRSDSYKPKYALSRKEAHEASYVMFCFAKGDSVQQRDRLSKHRTWRDTKYPTWNWYGLEYRVKGIKEHMRTKIYGKNCIVELIDEIERLKGQWGLWNCRLEFDDDTILEGSIQSDEHMVAPETFEEE